MTKVYYRNESGIKIDKSVMYDIKKCIRAAVQYEHREGDFEVNVTVCDNEYIHALNKEYRGVDRETDVLSFPMDDFEYAGIETVILGDIVVSAEKAVTQAQEYGHSFRREMCFLCVHSTLHLLGINHENGDEERLIMEKKQNEILDSLGITRDI